MTNKNKQETPREQVKQIYKELKNKKEQTENIADKSQKEKFAKEIAQAIKGAIAKDVAEEKKEAETAALAEATKSTSKMLDKRVKTSPLNGDLALQKIVQYRKGLKGQKAALFLVFTFIVLKIVLSMFEAVGSFDAKTAQASTVSKAKIVPYLTSERIEILKKLDLRRAELEKQRQKLKEKEDELKQQEEELAVKFVKLSDVLEKLSTIRKKDNKRRESKLTHLASVYGSMHPKEAAKLIAQLDKQMALRLLQRMPEKRIAQILSSMSQEKALELTRLLGAE
ncbi:MAG: hypothetical protein D6780_03485 [Candidatus Dadabacteria bacterium]|nr:MAG: hypothetical protein D6780_03485 [Candidatus Dadabacteria bacterium]